MWEVFKTILCYIRYDLEHEGYYTLKKVLIVSMYIVVGICFGAGQYEEIKNGTDSKKLATIYVSKNDSEGLVNSEVYNDIDFTLLFYGMLLSI